MPIIGKHDQRPGDYRAYVSAQNKEQAKIIRQDNFRIAEHAFAIVEAPTVRTIKISNTLTFPSSCQSLYFRLQGFRPLDDRSGVGDENQHNSALPVSDLRRPVALLFHHLAF